MNNLTKGLQNGLVLWLNEQGKDVSGNGNNGVLVNSPTVVRRSQQKGLSYPTNAYIGSIPSSFSIGNIYTCSFWINIPSLGNYERSITKWNGGDGNTGRGWVIQIDNVGKLSAGTNSNGTFFGQGSTDAIAINKWNMCTYTFDSSIGYSFYINGNKSATINQSGTLQPTGTNSNNVEINRLFWSIYYYGTNGVKYGSIMIWNRALSPTEIQQLYYGTFIK